MVPLLAKRYPLDNPAWKKWQSVAPKSDALVGDWSFSGHLPGKGELAGVMSVSADGSDTFKVSVKGQYADGTPFNGDGSAILYTGYEWRGNVTIDGVTMRQVFAAQGNAMQGRMFEAEHDERGLDFVAAKQGSARLLAVQPGYLKAGSESEVTLIGSGLSGKPNFGKGVEVLEVIEQSPQRIKVKLKAAANAQPGLRAVTVGTLKGPSLSVYSQIAEVKVVPEFSVARIGEGGGSTPKVQGRFDAEAWARAPMASRIASACSRRSGRSRPSTTAPGKTKTSSSPAPCRPTRACSHRAMPDRIRRAKCPPTTPATSR